MLTPDYYYLGRYHGGFFRHADVYYCPSRSLCWALHTGTETKFFVAVEVCLAYAKTMKLIKGDLAAITAELIEKARRADDKYFRVETPELHFVQR